MAHLVWPISSINIRIDDFRQTVRALSGWRAEVKAWWGGLSGMIADLRQDVDELRTELIVRNKLHYQFRYA